MTCYCRKKTKTAKNGTRRMRVKAADLKKTKKRDHDYGETRGEKGEAMSLEMEKGGTKKLFLFLEGGKSPPRKPV